MDGRSIYERDTGPAEFQKFVFRGHKQRFEENGPKHICDACNQGITSGSMITAEPFHYHEVRAGNRWFFDWTDKVRS